MKISILGAGTVGSAMARAFAQAGHTVYIANSRNPDTIPEELLSYGKVVPVWKEELPEKADILLLAVRWKDLEKALQSLEGLEGKTIIDVTNNTDEDFNLIDTGGLPSSRVVQDMVPRSKVVKAFNTFSITKYYTDGGKGILSFVSGDHEDANQAVSELIRSLGFEPFIVGSLDFGGRLTNVKGRLAGKAFKKEDAERIIEEERKKDQDSPKTPDR
jgi:hypothetical protein